MVNDEPLEFESYLVSCRLAASTATCLACSGVQGHAADGCLGRALTLMPPNVLLTTVRCDAVQAACELCSRAAAAK